MSLNLFGNSNDDGPDGSFVPEHKVEPGSYGMSSSKENSRATANEWSATQDELGEPEEVREREKRDDAAFEEQTRLPGTSPTNVKDADKGLGQRMYDEVGKLNNEASKEYLAS